MEMSIGRTGPPVTILRATYDLFADLLEEKNLFEEDWEKGRLNDEYVNQQSETERERRDLDNATKYNDQLESHIKDFIRSDRFRLNHENNNRASSVISLRLGQRFLVFSHSLCVNALQMYRKGITADTRGFLLDRHGPKHSFTHRYAFDINQIGSVFSCAYTDEGIHALAKSKMSQQNVSKGAWSFHIDKSGRSCLLAISIHLTNWLANLHSKIFQHKKEGRINPGIQSLREVDMDIESQNNVSADKNTDSSTTSNALRTPFKVFMEYEYPDIECKWFQEVIWKHVANSIQELGRSITEEVLNVTDVSGVVEVKPKRGSKRKVLIMSNMISSNTVLEYILRPSKCATVLCENFVLCIMAILIHEKILSNEDLKNNEFPSDMYKQTRDLYINMLQTIEYSIKSNNETNFKSQRFMKIFESGFQLFSSRKTPTKFLPVHLLGNRPQIHEEEEEIWETGQEGEDENHGQMSTAKRCPVCHRDWPEEMQWPPAQLRFGDIKVLKNYQDHNEHK